MLTTIDNIYLNRDDYSRHDPDASVIKARILFTPNTGLAGEILRVRLYRYGGWLIATKTVTLNGAYPSGVVVEFDLNGTECYHKPDTSEPHKAIYNARCGEYYIVADEEAGSATKQTPVFWILPVTRDFLLRTFHFGQTMAAAEVLAPVAQPSKITGVKIVGTSEFMVKGIHRIVYDNSDKSLALDSSLTGGGAGDAVTIVPGKRRYTIIDSTVVAGEEYLILDVDYYELPDSDQVEEIVIDNQIMPDESFRYFLMSGYSWAWSDLSFPVEPHIITTVAEDGIEYDKLVDPVALENIASGAWPSFKIPYRQLLHLYWLKGKFNEGTVIEIPDEWRVESKKSGLIQFVPRNASMIPFVSNGLGLWAASLRNVPEFWHFRGIFGLPYINSGSEYGVALDAILHRAAIEIFVTSGSAYRAGFSSESISRDGVSNSVTYTSSAMYGIYSADIMEHRKWLDDDWSRFKRKIRGIPAVMV